MFDFFFLYRKIASQSSHNSVAPYVKLEPARSFLHPGDSIVVDCKSSSPDSTVTWKREGYQRLPSNFHVCIWHCRRLNLIHMINFRNNFSNKEFDWSSPMPKVSMLADTFVYAKQVTDKCLNRNMN